MASVALFSFAGGNIGKLLILLLRWQGKENSQNNFPPSCRKITQCDFCWGMLSLCGTLLFIRFSFLLFRILMNLGKGGVYESMAFHWWSEILKVWNVERGYRVLWCHCSPSHSTGIKNCTSTTVLYMFCSFPLSFPLVELLMNHFVCEREKKYTGLLNIYFTVFQRTQAMGKTS